MLNFWQKLNKPIYALAPMADVNDIGFRTVCEEFGADVIYSEMASATALNYKADKTLDLILGNHQVPYVVQLFGPEATHYPLAVQLIEKQIQPAGIDVNFGCPVPKVLKQGAGVALFQDLKKSREVLLTLRASTNLPISIKVRIRAGEIRLDQFLKNIEDIDIQAIMIHGRSFAEGFFGDIDTQAIRNARDYFGGIILANGGINTALDAERILSETGADGVGIARGAMGKPWLFEQIKNKPACRQVGKKEIKNIDDIFGIALRHAEILVGAKGESAIPSLRKHLSWYVSGLPDASVLRSKLVQVNSLEEIRGIIDSRKQTRDNRLQKTPACR